MKALSTWRRLQRAEGTSSLDIQQLHKRAAHKNLRRTGSRRYPLPAPSLCGRTGAGNPSGGPGIQCFMIVMGSSGTSVWQERWISSTPQTPLLKNHRTRPLIIPQAKEAADQTQ
ncbi:MAG: hypothetical protein R2875_16975 [Desulfobacterales bacterium]